MNLVSKMALIFLIARDPVTAENSWAQVEGFLSPHDAPPRSLGTDR
jgi:hypothetical protein